MFAWRGAKPGQWLSGQTSIISGAVEGGLEGESAATNDVIVDHADHDAAGGDSGSLWVQRVRSGRDEVGVNEVGTVGSVGQQLIGTSRFAGCNSSDLVR